MAPTTLFENYTGLPFKCFSHYTQLFNNRILVYESSVFLFRGRFLFSFGCFLLGTLGVFLFGAILFGVFVGFFQFLPACRKKKSYKTQEKSLLPLQSSHFLPLEKKS